MIHVPHIHNYVHTPSLQVDHGWCEGTKNGERGMFPDNFVKLRPARVHSLASSDQPERMRPATVTPLASSKLLESMMRPATITPLASSKLLESMMRPATVNPAATGKPSAIMHNIGFFVGFHSISLECSRFRKISIFFSGSRSSEALVVLRYRLVPVVLPINTADKYRHTD